MLLMLPSLITARLPVLVRPSPPRFLNYGDKCEFPIIVQNLTEKEITVKYVKEIQKTCFPVHDRPSGIAYDFWKSSGTAGLPKIICNS